MLLRKADQDRDGHLDYEEFVRVVRYLQIWMNIFETNPLLTLNISIICLKPTDYLPETYHLSIWNLLIAYVIHTHFDHFNSNQIIFFNLKSAIYIWKKNKISKKLFTQLYSITNNNKIYIWFKYFGTSLWNRTWPQMKINFSEF